MTPFEYASPTTIDEVITLLGQDRDGATRPLAGGTDLIPLMKADVAAPSRLVNIKRLAELPGGIRFRRRYSVLAEAAAVAATPQLRNMATLGGNLLQRPRCWYFRNPRLTCWSKGGEECPAYAGENQFHALFGGGPCYAVHPSDLASALLALDAEVRGIVDPDVDGPECLFDCHRCGLDLISMRDVRRQDQCSATGRFNLSARDFQPIASPCHKPDISSPLREGSDGGATDAGRCPGDHNDLRLL